MGSGWRWEAGIAGGMDNLGRSGRRVNWPRCSVCNGMTSVGKLGFEDSDLYGRASHGRSWLVNQLRCRRQQRINQRG
jgi:hypothetical protein